MAQPISVAVAIDKINRAQTLLEEVRIAAAEGKLLTAQERVLDVSNLLVELGLWIATASGHRDGYEAGKRDA